MVWAFADFMTGQGKRNEVLPYLKRLMNPWFRIPLPGFLIHLFIISDYIPGILD